MRQIVEPSVGHPQRLAPLALRIPDDADARREVPEIVPGDRLPRHPVVTREDEPCRSVGEDRTMEPGVETRAIEVRNLAWSAVSRQVRVPSEAGIQRHVRRQAPVVLGVQPDVVGSHLRPGRRADRERRRSAQHVIGQAQAGHLTGERGVARGGRVRLRIVPRADVIGADSELMLPAEDAEIIRDLVHPRRRGRRQPRRHGEAARHAQAQVVGQDRRGLDADIGVVEQRNVLFGVSASIHRHAEPVDRVCC